jgi:ParB family chromosome partitioning protein
LVELIKERGVPGVLLVRKTDDNRLELIDGERRLRATIRARKEGAEIPGVPVKVAKKGTNEINLFYDAINANGGKDFLPTEEADAFKRLRNWGVEVKDIAINTGRSIGHVRNRLELAEASPDVKAAVNAGEITIGDAQVIAKTPSVDGQRAALKKKQVAPKSRKQVFKIKNGIVHQTGFKDRVCKPIRDILANPQLLDQIKEQGFDPGSLRLTIDPVEKL